MKPFSIKSSRSRNHGFSAKLDGELYGDPVESVGVRGRNCQYSMPCL